MGTSEKCGGTAMSPFPHRHSRIQVVGTASQKGTSLSTRTGHRRHSPTLLEDPTTIHKSDREAFTVHHPQPQRCLSSPPQMLTVQKNATHFSHWAEFGRTRRRVRGNEIPTSVWRVSLGDDCCGSLPRRVEKNMKNMDDLKVPLGLFWGHPDMALQRVRGHA